MIDKNTEPMDMNAPPRPAAPLRPEYRERLLAAMLVAQAEARAATLAPAPLSAEFRMRLQACVSAEARRYQRRRLLYLRCQYGAAACVVLCAIVGSLFCIEPEAAKAPGAVQAVACRTITAEGNGDYLDTLTITAADNTVLRVRVPGRSSATISEDVI